MKKQTKSTKTTTHTTTPPSPTGPGSWFHQGLSPQVEAHLAQTEPTATPTAAEALDLTPARQAPPERDIHQAIHGAPPPPVCHRIYTAPANARPAIDHELRQANRQLPAKTILDTLQTEMPEAYCAAQLIGSWVWVSFPSKQPATITARLAQLGFHWNSKRQSWQHPGGVSARHGSTGDPSAKYPTTEAAQAVA